MVGSIRTQGRNVLRNLAVITMFWSIPMGSVFSQNQDRNSFNVNEVRRVYCASYGSADLVTPPLNILDALNHVRDFIDRTTRQDAVIQCYWGESQHQDGRHVLYLMPNLQKRELKATAIATAAYDKLPGSGIWLNGGQRLHTGITPFAELTLSESVRYCFGVYGIFSQPNQAGEYRQCSWGGITLPIRRHGDIVTMDFGNGWRTFDGRF